MGSVTTATELKADLDFFIRSQEDLARKHGGKVLVIHGQQVVGVYDDTLSAYLGAKKQYAPGSFMIQPCAPGPDAYTVSIASNNVVLALAPA